MQQADGPSFYLCLPLCGLLTECTRFSVSILSGILRPKFPPKVSNKYAQAHQRQIIEIEQCERLAKIQKYELRPQEKVDWKISFKKDEDSVSCDHRRYSGKAGLRYGLPPLRSQPTSHRASCHLPMETQVKSDKQKSPVSAEDMQTASQAESAFCRQKFEHVA